MEEPQSQCWRWLQFDEIHYIYAMLACNQFVSFERKHTYVVAVDISVEVVSALSASQTQLDQINQTKIHDWIEGGWILLLKCSPIVVKYQHAHIDSFDLNGDMHMRRRMIVDRDQQFNYAHAHTSSQSFRF